MQDTLVYAIVVGGGFIGLLSLTTLRWLPHLKPVVWTFYQKHVVYPHVLNRHRFAGPWTRLDVLAFGSYIATNTLCLLWFRLSTAQIGRRAANLSLINTTFLFAGPHLSMVAKVLGLPLGSARKAHLWSALLTVILLLIHVGVNVLIEKVPLSLQKSQYRFPVIGALSVVAIMIFALPFFRRFAYSIFLRGHEALAVLLLYSAWSHVPTDRLLARVCTYISCALLALLTCVQTVIAFYQNGMFTTRRGCRAVIHPHQDSQLERKDFEFNLDDGKRRGHRKDADRAILVQVVLSRPMTLDAGQYVLLWMPFVSYTSWIRSRPFTVLSWSRKGQTRLDLYVKVDRGLSATLLRRCAESEGASISFRAFVTGPFGISESVPRYESVLLIASGSGIAAVIPYLRKLIYGYNTSTCRTRRVHLVWQLKTLEMAIPLQATFNALLRDDTLDNGYILTISIYLEAGVVAKLGTHERAFVHGGVAKFSDIVHAEASGDFIKRLPNIEEEKGEMLILVSASGGIRDEVRNTVQGLLGNGVTMSELEFQP